MGWWIQITLLEMWNAFTSSLNYGILSLACLYVNRMFDFSPGMCSLWATCDLVQFQCGSPPALHAKGGCSFPQWPLAETHSSAIISQCAINTVSTERRWWERAVITQIMANSCIHFVTLAKHSVVNRSDYAAVLSSLIKEFENQFQDWKKKKSKTYVCNTRLYFQLIYIHYL